MDEPAKACWAQGVDDVLHSGSQQAVECAASLLRLLHAADTFPRGGLYRGYYAQAAALRYEQHWVRVLATQNATALPPMDVAWAWWVHRQSPAAYQAQLRQAGLAQVHTLSTRQAFGFSASNAQRYVWRGAAGRHPQWPPPAPGSTYDLVGETLAAAPVFAKELAGCMSKFAWQLRTWLRPHFLEEAFLQRAASRYVRFLRLQAEDPSAPLVPAADIALLWHTHLGLSEHYAAACAALMGPGAEPLRPAYVDLGGGLDGAYRRTSELYEARYGEPYDSDATGWVSRTTQYVLATARCPLALCRTVLDLNPQASRQQSAIDRVERAVKVGFTGGATSVPRAGAHMLYLAWLAGRRAGEEVANRCCCLRLPLPGREARLRDRTLGHAAAAIINTSFFIDLPADDTHPYLQAIALRPSPAKSKGAEDDSASSADGSSEASAEGHAAAAAAAEQEAPAAAPPGFSPSDPEAYLCGQSHFLKGLAELLGGAGECAGAVKQGAAKMPLPAHGADEGPSPLWALMARPGGADRFKQVFMAAWKKAQKYGVTVMQAHYQRGRSSSDGMGYYGGSGYYVSYFLWYNSTHPYNYDWMLSTNPAVFSGGLAVTYHPVPSSATGVDAAPAKCGAVASGGGGCGGCAGIAGGGGGCGGAGGCGGGGCGGGGCGGGG